MWFSFSFQNHKDDEEGVEEEENFDDEEDDDEPGLKDGKVFVIEKSIFTISDNLTILQKIVYNEDLEEDNSDWNDAEEDDDDEDIDSDGKIYIALK